MKLIPITEVDDHLIKMFEGWNQEYLKHATLWKTIEKYDLKEDQIGGDRGFILATATVPKPNYHTENDTAIMLTKRVTEDLEILTELGISLQFTYYKIKDNAKNDFKVVSCTIPEWMLGLTKDEILKEYKKANG